MIQVVYGREDATNPQVEEACAAANAKEFIDASPEGIHTLVWPLV
jgi:ABC-type multidrug transport system fused ATPase/permease subunit